MAVRVVVGEDEPLVREGIVHVLEASGFAVVGVAADAPELIRKTNAHKPDVVVTDIQMPPDRTDDGLRARRSRSAGPGRRRGWSCSRGSSRTATRSKRRRSGGGRRVSAQGARRRPSACSRSRCAGSRRAARRSPGRGRDAARRRRGRRGGRTRKRPGGARGPRRRARRNAGGRQPARRGDGDPRRDPARLISGEAHCGASGQRPRFAAHGNRVLIVDDDPAFRETIAEALAARGSEVAGAVATLAEARVALADLDLDAVLLDVNLPDGDGVAFAGELRGPRVVLTSTDAVPARLVQRAGAAGFVPKTELLATARRRYLAAEPAEERGAPSQRPV